MRYAIVNMSRALRVWNNPLLYQALNEDYIPIPIYCLDDKYLLGMEEGITYTGIPRMYGTRFNWLQECILDCKEHLKTKGLDLCILVGSPRDKVKSLIEMLIKNGASDIMAYSLAFPDEEEVMLNNTLQEVCNDFGIKFQVVRGFSTYINVFNMFGKVSAFPHYFKRFLNEAVKNLARGEGYVQVPHYSLAPWEEDLRSVLGETIELGVREMKKLPVVHKEVGSIREEVLEIPKGVLMEVNRVNYLDYLFREGGLFTYDYNKLQSSTLLSPLVNLGVIAPYEVFNECMDAYSELIKGKTTRVVLDKFQLFMKQMLLHSYGVGIGSIEKDNVRTLSSSIYGKCLDLSKYKGVEESKELIQSMCFSVQNDENVDSRNVEAVKVFIKILVNRGYVSKKVRMSIALCLNECGINPYVIRDLFRAFLIDYLGFNTYLGLGWCLGITTYKEVSYKPVSINKQLSKVEYGLSQGSINGWTNVDILSVPYLLEGNRLPVKKL